MTSKPVLLVLSLALAASGAFAADSPEQYDARGLPKFIVGACTHFGYRHGHLPATMEMLRQAGVSSSRDEASWALCEASKGKRSLPKYYEDYLDAAASYGVIPLNILLASNRLYDNANYPKSPEALEAYGKYCEFIVSSMKSRVRLYQVWNEWDGGCGMPEKYKGTGDAESYVKLLKSVYGRIKGIEPDSVVVSNSVCTGDQFLERLLDLGMLECCDVVALHTYLKGTPEDWAARMRKVDALLKSRNRGVEVPMYVTEMSWSVQVGEGGVSQETSAKYLARLYLLARSFHFLKGVWWYNMQDNSLNPAASGDNMGLIRPDFSPKPSYFVMKDISPIASRAEFIEKAETGVPDAWLLKFRLDGKDVWAVWNACEENEARFTFRSKAKNPSPVSIRFAGGVSAERSWEDREWDNAQWGGDSAAPAKKGQLRLSVKGWPILIEGDLSEVVLANVKTIDFPDSVRPGFATAASSLPAFGIVASKTGQPSEECNFSLASNYRSMEGKSWEGPKDLGGKFSINYDRDNIFLNVSVEDNVQASAPSASEAWQYDSLQFAFRVLNPKNAMARSEFTAALTEKAGPVLLMATTQGSLKPGPLKIAPDAIARNGTKTSYRLSIPADALGVQAFEKGMILQFSLLANDNDGSGRKGYLHWGDGIGQDKNPAKYNLLILN